MVWPSMGDACRRSIHLKDGVEASQRVRSSGRSASSSTLAFNEQSGNCSGPEVGFEDSKPVSGQLPCSRQYANHQKSDDGALLRAAQVAYNIWLDVHKTQCVDR